MEVDKDRLAKLLSMTSSDHDGEALAAIRKANQLLRANGTTWSDVLGTSELALEPPQPEAPRYAPRPAPVMPPQPPPGYQQLRRYRNALRREPFLPRVLGFPFWLFVEILALIFPRAYLNTRGGFIVSVFALGMVAGIAGWIWLGYYLLFIA